MARKKVEVPSELFDKRLPKGYLSHSQYTLFKTCPQAYKFQYVDGHQTQARPSFLRGTSVHHGAEVSLLVKKAGGAPSLEQGLTTVEAHFDAEKASIKNWDDSTPEATKSSALRLYTLYHQACLPKLNPIEVEKPFLTRVGTVTVHGHIDLIEMCKTVPSDPGVLIVADLKTGDSKWSENDVAKDTQLTLYSLVTGTIHVRIDNLVDTKTPKYHDLQDTRDPVAYRNLIEDLEETADTISKGVFAKCAIDSWKCSTRWCDFWDRCRGRKL